MDDYWDEDFDNNKNCEQEEKISKLINEVGVPAKIQFIVFQKFCSEKSEMNF